MTAPASLYAPRPCRLLTVSGLTPQEKLFRLQLVDGSSLGHQPGQFIQLSIPGLTEAPISVANSPTRGTVFELAVRRAGRLTGALHKLAPGALIGIRGPFGRPFQLDALRGKQLLLIAGGCGLAPLRSLIQYCQDRPEEFAAVHILYGARSPADLLFKDDLAAWQRSERLDCRYTVDRIPADSCYDGETGLLPRLLSQLELDPANCSAVLVGPPPMYRPVIAELRRLGLSGERRIMLSLERQMRCGVGKCGHCSIEHLTCCSDGPVFWLEEVEALRGAL
ncbi:NAD(P)H-flavin reductase [Geothermobacter ehrlichii]|uniref:NAD(P)H-flavin reductase n=1 Tax=Geothermobacter ehrlichii TaxID=213224 RepID=A0A5D3WGK5_9BACT|nr:FAD/NAD(P)-binding protein [Geothermobacter ehrlichii]TYO96654.1 NAD(P)H-flavin reductase [Geothermobacter ehrlichii]